MSHTQNPSDKELLERIRSEDQEAFRILIDRYEFQVAATVKGMLGNRAEAEDIGQETFIRFIRSINKFREESSIGTYLTRIAINLSLNELKRQERQNRRFFSVSGYDEEEMIYPSEEMTDMEDMELKEMVHKAIGKLKPEFKSVIVLRMLREYSTNETADILDIPVGTVLSRYSRAIDKLRILLKPYLNSHEINV
ncbi:MAG TPA: sigma-70 family RNA polymerase sigma factor [Balneolales bacterium]|nr:sigma-70 family RNA polymerase sigma factor [Balneolales bacterium]